MTHRDGSCLGVSRPAYMSLPSPNIPTAEDEEKPQEVSHQSGQFYVLIWLFTVISFLVAVFICEKYKEKIDKNDDHLTPWSYLVFC